ncbi:MAG: hypothetical protein IPJ52_00935, partial [Rhodocyclaceae bacterium]|nr:hypothetical protein [Rhodocyclaceae bacterium]
GYRHHPTNTVMGTGDGDNLSGHRRQRSHRRPGRVTTSSAAPTATTSCWGDGDDDIVGQLGDDPVVEAARVMTGWGGNNGDDRLYAENKPPCRRHRRPGRHGHRRARRHPGRRYGADQVVGVTGNDILFGGRDDDISSAAPPTTPSQPTGSPGASTPPGRGGRQTQTAGDTTTYQPV